METIVQPESQPAAPGEVELALRQRIVELEQANRKLTQECHRYRQVLTSIPAAVNLSLGADFITDLANPTYLKTVGQDYSLIGRPLREAMPEFEAQGFFALMDEVYRSGQPFVGRETPVQLKRTEAEEASFTQGWFDFIYRPLLTEDGQIEGVFVYAVDVTEQVKSRQALEMERQRLQDVFTHAPAAIAVVRGPSYVFELTNEPYMRLLGRQDSIIGLAVLEALPEVEHQGFMELLDEVRRSGIPFVGQEMPIYFDRNGDGKRQEAFLNFVYQPLFAPDGSGKVESILAHVVDVTEQVRSRQQIEQLSLLKDEFLAIASHDLRTPITSIKGYLQLLERNLLKQHQNQLASQSREHDQPGLPDSSSINRYSRNNLQLVGTVLEQTNRLNELINRLLDFSKISEGQLNLEYSEGANLIKLVQQVIANLNMTTEQHQIVMDPARPDDLIMRYDEAKLEQVLNNLLSNAIKYSPVGTTITVGIELPASQPEAEVVVWVRDEGHGISQEQQTHLFERFFRVQNEHTNGKAGLGLGLYISHEIVRQHGGRLWVDSELGQGSTFYVALPFQRQRRAV